MVCRFSWSPVQGADHYELWVSKLNGGGVVIHLTDLTPVSYTPAANMTVGNYRVWVRAVSTSGAFSSWSAFVDFSITNDETSPELLNADELSSILLSSISSNEEQEPPIEPPTETQIAVDENGDPSHSGYSTSTNG